jgi:myo-inositol 2-dehydrogenase / D-chiro-inositol 1-dehydrogenase
MPIQKTRSINRRSFFHSCGIAAGCAAIVRAGDPRDRIRAAEIGSAATDKNSRPGIGAIGVRYQGSVIADKAREYGDIVAIADVDRHVREQARASFGSTPEIYEDYRKLLDNKKVEIVLIATPDHWHTKMLIDALGAGKHVYCEKPLTLTIDEGKQILRAVKQSERVVQVGSWQRSDHRFRLAVEMVRQGRIGTLEKVDVVLGKNVVGGPFASVPIPSQLNWDLWQGQTPSVPYIPERSHYTFRWWQEYSGGQLTDWGAHNIDIAQWAIHSNPISVEGTAAYPSTPNGYNVPVDFSVRYRYANGVLMTVSDTGRSGIMFTGSTGRIFVNREVLTGKAVEELSEIPLPTDSYTLYDFDNRSRPQRAGKLDSIKNHMGNFFDCLANGRTPISDCESQHRSASTCHLGTLALRLGRAISWDPIAETFPGDAEATAMLSRVQRTGFETGA